VPQAAVIGERPERLTDARSPSKRSLRALDWVNFFKADAQATVGPYLAIFLSAARHWAPRRIGMAMSVPGLVTVLAQTPAGALVDWAPSKRRVLAGAALSLSAGCLLLATATGLGEIIFAQTIIAAASIVMPPAIAAVSVGLVGHRSFAERTGRNEASSHLGAVAGAAAAGAAAYWIASAGLFYMAALMAAGAALAGAAIREADVDPALAREAAKANGEGERIAAISELARDRRIAIFAAASMLFHLANAAMLPLVGEMLGAGHPTLAGPYMAACIIVAQIVMTPVALAAGRLAGVLGRKPVLLTGFAALPIRGLLFALTRQPALLVAVQALDGIGAGIFGVVALIVVSDLAQRTGRFNLLQGAISGCVAIGSSLSNLVAGAVAERAGYQAGFVLLSALAVTALGFLWAAMPETGPRQHKPASEE
jgi:predicted MFS family arabinose efflux permease